MLVSDGLIAWIGDDEGASIYRDEADDIVSLRGALVTPAFVDGHVHATATGLLLSGLDLTGCASLADMLERLRRHPQDSGVVIGHGWDETHWPEGRGPTTSDIDATVGDRAVYLSRIDVHSAVVSTTLRRQHPDLSTLTGFDDDGPLASAAHHRIRDTVLSGITRAQRDRAQYATLARAASLGIASVHEMAGPTISSDTDLVDLLALGRQPQMPEVVGYWGEIDGHERARELGARGAAGDLFVDGSLGSHTACLRLPYADHPSTGRAYLDVEQVRRHVVTASRLGQQSGFHVIGDGGHDIVMDAFRAAADEMGVAAVAKPRHRLEHVEMPDRAQIESMALLGIVASVQSAFDARWGGASGMYAARLGAARAGELNPFAAMAAAGVTLALGSDAPVTSLDPWGSVRAAALHRSPAHRISVHAAFAAHTRGGRLAARDEGRESGVLEVGASATYAVWQPTPLIMHAAPVLPELSPDAGSPACWRTVRAGTTIFDAGALE